MTASLTLSFPPNGANTWREPVATATALPATAQLGESRVAQDTGILYTWPGGSWIAAAGGAGGIVFQTIDSSGGPQGITTMSPSSLHGSLQLIKKTSTDTNTVTLTPPSGTIGDGTQGATFVFNEPGRTVGLTSDGVNTYVVT